METEYAVINIHGKVINIFHSFRDRNGAQEYYPHVSVIPTNEVPAYLLNSWHNKARA